MQRLIREWFERTTASLTVAIIRLKKRERERSKRIEESTIMFIRYGLSIQYIKGITLPKRNNSIFKHVITLNEVV